MQQGRVFRKQDVAFLTNGIMSENHDRARPDRTLYTHTHTHTHTHTRLARAALEMVSPQFKSLLTCEHASDLITMTTVSTG